MMAMPASSHKYVMLKIIAYRQQHACRRRQVGAQLVVKHGEAWHHETDQEDEQRDHHRDQQAGIEQGSHQLLAEGKRNSLEGKIPRQNIFQLPASFSCQQGGGVDQGKAALGFKSSGERFPSAHARGYIFQLCAEGWVLLAFDQHVERANNGQAGADQGKKLLVEDDEGFQVGFLAAASAAHAARPHRVDVVAGLGEAAAQFFRRSRQPAPAPECVPAHLPA